MLMENGYMAHRSGDVLVALEPGTGTLTFVVGGTEDEGEWDRTADPAAGAGPDDPLPARTGTSGSSKPNSRLRRIG